MISTESKYIDLYSFDSKFKEYCGQFRYFWAIGTGLAANSTQIKAPDHKAGFAIVYNEAANNWSYIEDHRKSIVYSISDKTEHIINYIGPIKIGFTKLKPETEFHTWNGSEWVDNRTAEEIAEYKRSQYLTLTSRQFHITLVKHQLEDVISEAIESIEDAEQKALVKIEFNKATGFKRTGTSMLFMQDLLKMSDDELDRLWEYGLAIPD